MASPTPNPAQRPPPPTGRPAHRQAKAATDIDPRWILKALGAVVLAALICGYLTLCLLFYVGQWQLVLHPTQSAKPLSITGANADLVRFGPNESAIPQLTGWWIPAAAGARYSTTTLLYLPAGDGSLVDASTTLATLHSLGINIFAFDYRGYGQSAPTHPNQANLAADADAAWQYLRSSRGLTEQQIVPYGVGVGASLAAQIATQHGGTSALILESPRGDTLTTLIHDPRTNFLPTKLLFHENFPLAASLATLRTPKLFLTGKDQTDTFRNASDPKITVALEGVAGKLAAQPGFVPSINRFLDQYLPASPVPALTQPAR
jgi:pimeloyl-ACP methyl ester carboxylesterase